MKACMCTGVATHRTAHSTACRGQAVPLYLSEIAPPHMRGLLNQLFQLATTIGAACSPRGVGARW